MPTPDELRAIEQEIRQTELQSLEQARLGKAEVPIIYRACGYARKADGGPLTFVASEESPDRMEDIIAVDGWELREFKKNPVMLFAHDAGIAPIGRYRKVWTEGKQLLALPQFDMEDPFAAFIAGKYERGFMRGVSVGFRPLEWEAPNGDQKGMHFLKQELIEISAVPIPAHPHALARAYGDRKFTIVVPKVVEVPEPLLRGAIPYKKTPAAERGATWDAGAEVKAASVDDLKIMCAWVDSENANLKTAYKLPHHRAGGDHAVVFKAVASAIGVLNGGRGGADIPEGDVQAVYRHLAKHIRDDFDAEPAPLKEAGDMERKQDMGSMASKMRKMADMMSEMQDMMSGIADDMENGKDSYWPETKASTEGLAKKMRTMAGKLTDMAGMMSGMADDMGKSFQAGGSGPDDQKEPDGSLSPQDIERLAHAFDGMQPARRA